MPLAVIAVAGALLLHESGQIAAVSRTRYVRERQKRQRRETSSHTTRSHVTSRIPLARRCSPRALAAPVHSEHTLTPRQNATVSRAGSVRDRQSSWQRLASLHTTRSHVTSRIPHAHR